MGGSLGLHPSPAETSAVRRSVRDFWSARSIKLAFPDQNGKDFHHVCSNDDATLKTFDPVLSQAAIVPIVKSIHPADLIPAKSSQVFEEQGHDFGEYDVTRQSQQAHGPLILNSVFHAHLVNGSPKYTEVQDSEFLHTIWGDIRLRTVTYELHDGRGAAYISFLGFNATLAGEMHVTPSTGRVTIGDVTTSDLELPGNLNSAIAVMVSELTGQILRGEDVTLSSWIEIGRKGGLQCILGTVVVIGQQLGSPLLVATWPTLTTAFNLLQQLPFVLWDDGPLDKHLTVAMLQDLGGIFVDLLIFTLLFNSPFLSSVMSLRCIVGEAAKTRLECYQGLISEQEMNLITSATTERAGLAHCLGVLGALLGSSTELLGGHMFHGLRAAIGGALGGVAGVFLTSC